MKKQLTKLIASILSLTLAATLVGMSSYAWLTISNSPEVNGIQVNIGSSTTIMVAADMVVHNPNGTVSHFPGEFQQSLSFTDWETYDYLESLTGLTPVSTVDGINWVLPDYYEDGDQKVRLGQAMAGQIKDITEFSVDTALTCANVAADTQQVGQTGSYIYIDFWVVAPVDGYALRVSTGSDEENTGSFVITRMEPTVNADGSYVLTAADETAAATVRIGFLVNKNWASYTDAKHYAGSKWYDKRYSELMGQYQEPGEDISNFSAALNRFTVYEPNGDLHPQNQLTGYHVTTPLGVTDGNIGAVSMEDRLSVQMTNGWKIQDNQEQTLLEQEFTAAIFGKDMSKMSVNEVTDYFYNQRLQGLLMPYISRGQFVENTAKLYDAAVDGVVAGDSEALDQLAGATEDTHITILEKNVPQRIRMFIWLEGQDVDCVNQDTISNLIVNLEFAGSKH